MSPYKNFQEATKSYFASVPFLSFLMTASIFVFGAGALFYLVESFVSVAGVLTSIGRILMFTGLILTVIKEDVMTLVITSGAISLICLIAWIVGLVGGSYYGVRFGGFFNFEPFLYFLGFGTITTLTFVKSEKFKQMRAENAVKAQARAQAQAQAQAQYQQQQQQYQQQQQQYQQQYQQQPMQQPVAPQTPPPVAPVASPVVPQAAPVSSAAKCVSCGADLAQGAAFCGKCGAKQ